MSEKKHGDQTMDFAKQLAKLEDVAKSKVLERVAVLETRQKVMWGVFIAVIAERVVDYLKGGV